MAELDNLIRSCQEDQGVLLKNVKYPKLLIKYLQELRDDIIGLDSLKDDISDQTRQLIKKMENSDPKGKSYNRAMLNTVIYSSPGTGKCLDPNEKILMFDGTFKFVRNIVPGDLLMGDDSTPRTVLSTTSGTDQMFRITPEHGESYIVNEPHILSLRCNYRFRIVVGSSYYRVRWMVNGIKRERIFKFIGRSRLDIYRKAQAFRSKMEDKYRIIDLSLKRYLTKSHQWKRYYRGYRVGVDFPERPVGSDPYNVGYRLGEISENYRINSRSIRLRVLAGIIDRTRFNNFDRGYEIRLKRRNPIPSIIYLIRSLGFLIERKGDRIRISGKEIDEIPVKRNPIRKRGISKDDRLKVESLGIGPYCGFEIDGNRRFILKDFTVTHNTTVAKKLAKIWYALGYLDNSETKDTVRRLQSQTTSSPASIEILTLILIYGYILLTYLVAGFKSLYSKYGYRSLILIVGGIIIIGLIVWYLFGPRLKIWVSGMMGNSPDKPTNQARILDDLPKSDLTDPKEENIVKVVGRVEFVAGYVGQSALKTKALLESCLGKVLVIDEAYSLLTGHNDSFGFEVLTELNRFMSENAGKIVVIFCGYEKLMKRGIFKEQPGLPRRCMWHFRLPKYRPTDLFRIFCLQAKGEDLKVGSNMGEREEIVKLFTNNMEAFPSFAGDTERLVNFAVLEYNREVFSGTTLPNDNTLRPIHIQRGIEKLRRNNITRESEVEESTETQDRTRTSRELLNILNRLQTKKNKEIKEIKEDKEIKEIKEDKENDRVEVS